MICNYTFECKTNTLSYIDIVRAEMGQNRSEQTNPSFMQNCVFTKNFEAGTK